MVLGEENQVEMGFSLKREGKIVLSAQTQTHLLLLAVENKGGDNKFASVDKRSVAIGWTG